jgi:hypothetical protein
MSEPQPVKIDGQTSPVKVEVADPLKLAPTESAAPTVEKTVETHEKTVTSGDVAQTSAVATNARFDDWVRFFLAEQIIAGFLFIVIYGQVMGKTPDQNTLMVYVSFVSLSLGFYLGSSYGSNLKDKAKA